MGKKRITYDCNDLDKPLNHAITDHHHHHHHRHRHNPQKAKKIKPDAKLLHTLSSHLKKLGKSRPRNTTLSLSTPPPPPPPSATTISHENTKRRHGHQCHKDHRRDWFMGLDSDHDHHRHDDGDDMGVFKFGKELCWKTLLSENNNEDLFGGDCVFAPDLNACRKMVLVIGEDGFGCGSYIPDPVVKWDNGDEGNCLYDILKLSSQEDMINEFLKVNLFVS